MVKHVSLIRKPICCDVSNQSDPLQRPVNNGYPGLLGGMSADKRLVCLLCSRVSDDVSSLITPQ